MPRLGLLAPAEEDCEARCDEANIPREGSPLVRCEEANIPREGPL